MLDVFFGGLGFHPAALDYSDETCSHGCAYCFANINKAYREGNLTGAIKKFYAKNDTTLVGWLLRQGYPICVSNRTDAFAKNNVRNTRALFTHLAERDNGIFIQTKGGEGIGEIIETLPKKPVIYTSITMIDDDLAKTVEPAAPLPSKRIEQARYFVDRGYIVIAAINPCSMTWLPPEDFDRLIVQFREAGIKRVVIEMLDMSPSRMRAISTGRKTRLGDAPQTIGKTDRQYVRECTAKLIEAGFMVAKKGMPYRSDFYVEVDKQLGRVMPSYQTFVNELAARRAEEVCFADFLEFWARHLDVDAEIRANALRGYLLRTGFQVWKDNQTVPTYRHLAAVCWNDKRNHASIQNHILLSRAEVNGIPTLDDDGNAVLRFSQPLN